MLYQAGDGLYLDVSHQAQLQATMDVLMWMKNIPDRGKGALQEAHQGSL